MNDDNTFIIINDKGEEVRAEILFTYEDESKGFKRNFIAYTDNTLDEEGNTRVYASIFNPEEENPELIPITDDEDWELIEGILSYLQEE